MRIVLETEKNVKYEVSIYVTSCARKFGGLGVYVTFS